MLHKFAPKESIQLNLFVSLALDLSGIFLNANVWDLKCQIQSSLYCFRLSFLLAAVHHSRIYCRDVRSVRVALMMFSSLADVALKGPSVLHHQLLSLHIAWAEWRRWTLTHVHMTRLPVSAAIRTGLVTWLHSFPSCFFTEFLTDIIVWMWVCACV